MRCPAAEQHTKSTIGPRFSPPAPLTTSALGDSAYVAYDARPLARFLIVDCRANIANLQLRVSQTTPKRDCASERRLELAEPHSASNFSPHRMLCRFLPAVWLVFLATGRGLDHPHGPGEIRVWSPASRMSRHAGLRCAVALCSPALLDWLPPPLEFDESHSEASSQAQAFGRQRDRVRQSPRSGEVPSPLIDWMEPG